MWAAPGWPPGRTCTSSSSRTASTSIRRRPSAAANLARRSRTGSAVPSRRRSRRCWRSWTRRPCRRVPRWPRADPQGTRGRAMTLCAGLISGTSMDGVEAVLLDAGDSLRVRDALHLDYPPGLAARLKRAVAAPAACGLDELGYLDAAIGEVFADAAAALLRKAGVDAREVRIIGSHGQTLLHRPRQAPAFTLQVGDPNRIAERTGIDVVADFRRRDMAAGGEGAPLVPAFHAAAFASPGEDRAVVNIGGIANITTLAADGAVGGFDTGPGNCLMDLWAEEHLGAPFDRDGALAARGCVDEELLATLLAEPYLALPPPKSTGRELFNRAWLAPALARHPAEVADVMATLSEFTARTIADALRAVPGFSPR